MSIFTDNININNNKIKDDTEQGEKEPKKEQEHFNDKEAKKDMKQYIKKKNNTLDRKIVIVNNYAIINQNRILLLKYGFYFLIILNIAYIAVSFNILPKILATMVLSLLSLVFCIFIIVIILKNSRLYKINMEEKYYPKKNPYNVLHYFNKKKKCDGTSVVLKKKNKHVQTLENLLLEIKRLAIRFDMYDDAKNADTHLKMIYDHKYENAPYSYKGTEQEILDEIKLHNDILTNLKVKITNDLQKQLIELKNKSNQYKKNMELALTSIQTDKKDKLDKDKIYKMEQYKFNMALKNINDMQHNLNRL